MVRDIAVIKGKNNISLLFLRNSDFPVLFKMKKKDSVSKKEN
jgi:hypothetical protein